MHRPTIPDDSNMHSHNLENLKPHILLLSVMIYLCNEQSIISHTLVYSFECSDGFPRLLLCCRSVVTQNWLPSTLYYRCGKQITF